MTNLANLGQITFFVFGAEINRLLIKFESIIAFWKIFCTGCRFGTSNCSSSKKVVIKECSHKQRRLDFIAPSNAQLTYGRANALTLT